MTSLPLNPAQGYYRYTVPEWGTDKPKPADKTPLWTPKPPTWHQTGKPVEQYYDLTLLKKSNVRLNDQLLPKPQESTIGDRMIHEPFPAEHPYASHVPRLKMFPSFSTTAEEPKRGIEARHTQPLSSETPAANFDVQIVHKTKGTGDRHEIQSLPPESLKKGLTWHGEQGFAQQVKVHGDRQSFYPIPTSSVVPNLLPREGTAMAISDRTATATRNLERQQWKTTYDRNHTGIGPVNQYKLDNHQDKMEYKTVTGGVEDDNIYPWFTNTYEPSRPQEGRLGNAQNPNYGVFTQMGAAQPDTGYVRKPTLTEREEERLLNGADHPNLPAPQNGKDMQWSEWTTTNHPEDRFTALVQRQMRDAPNPLPYEERGTDPLPEENKGYYVDEIRKREHDKMQQVEAENRWKRLEVLKPEHDIGVLNRKLNMSTDEEKVPAFYGHEGKYNEERTGLYKTSYDPSKLAYKLDSDPSKLGIRNNVNSFENSVHYPTDLNLPADILRANLETDMRKVPMFSERPDVFEVFEPFKRDRFIREQQLKPELVNARHRVQEGDVLQRESTMGAGYNTQKFLQENVLHPFARSEPLSLMSNQNQNLQNVRVNSKQVKFSDQITVGEGAGSAPLMVSKASIENPKVMLYSPRAPIAPRHVKPLMPLSKSLDLTPVKDPGFQSMVRSSEIFQSRPGTPKPKPAPAQSDDLFLAQKGVTTAKNQFESKSSNLGIGSSYNMFKTSYDNQFRPSTTPSGDPRYNWEPGCGVPRPQTTLLKLQNSFSKSDAYRRLANHFPEKNPNLIDNVEKGRKHEFMSLNAQVLRGTLVNA